MADRPLTGVLCHVYTHICIHTSYRCILHTPLLSTHHMLIFYYTRIIHIPYTTYAYPFLYSLYHYTSSSYLPVYTSIYTPIFQQDDIPAALVAYNKAQMEQFDKAIDRKIKTLELERRKKEKMMYINPALGLEAKERGKCICHV